MTVADFIKLLQAEPEPSDAELKAAAGFAKNAMKELEKDPFGEAIKYVYGQGFYLPTLVDGRIIRWVPPNLAEKYTRNLDRLYPW